MGASPRKGDLLSDAIIHDRRVHEFGAIIRIQPQDRNREEGTSVLQRSHHCILALMQQREALGPARGDVGQHQRREVTPLGVGATVGDQVRFQEARLNLIPLAEGANGDLAFEQRASLCRRKTTQAALAIGMQHAISRRGAHREQLVAVCLGQVQMSMPLQGRNQRGQERNQTFRANPIGSIPGQEQRSSDLLPIVLTGTLRGLLGLLGMIEQSPGILTVISSDSSKIIHQGLSPGR